MTGLTFTGNTDMEALTVDTTWSGTAINGSLTVGTNVSLTSLTCSSDNLNTLSVTGNDDLATINFTGVTKIGASGTPTVNIYGNDFTASAVDASDGATNAANGAAGDLGSWTTSSGMETLKGYLTAVDADANATAYVFWDTVESFTDEALAETTDKLYSSIAAVTAQDDKIKILTLKPNAAGSGSTATKGKIGWVVTSIAAADQVQIIANMTTLFANGAGVTYNGGQLVLTANPTLDVAAIKNAAHVVNATAANVDTNPYS